MRFEETAIDEDIPTIVKARVYDYYEDMPFENYKIKIGEYKYGSGIGPSQFQRFVDSVWNVYFSPLRIDNDSIGKSFTKEFIFYYFHPVNLKVTLNDIESLPVKISLDLSNSRPEDLDLSGVELERTVFLSPTSTENKIYFSRRNSDNLNQSFFIQAPASSPTGTLDFTIIINDSDFQ
ncbi:MAG: hypothetical protein QNK89_11165 [Lacinutrix sp.]|uniref:hypothetical protein n=1 Tax=Lacinutrix sp. TaxID=1937692 RepID=UPI0030AE6BB1